MDHSLEDRKVDPMVGHSLEDRRGGQKVDRVVARKEGQKVDRLVACSHGAGFEIRRGREAGLMEEGAVLLP